MSHEIERPNVEAQPHAMADIFGRLEKHLKHGERLQFMTNDELAYLKERFSNNPFEILYAPHMEWPQGFKHLHVYNVHVSKPGAKKCHIEPGILITFGQYVRGGSMFAVLDCGKYGVVHCAPAYLSPMVPEAAEQHVPVAIRRQGRRIVRAMRDIGSVPGQEDITLLNIAQNLMLNRRFMEFTEARLGIKRAAGVFDGFESAAESVVGESASFALGTAKILEKPEREYVGERCVQILMAMGIGPGNLYHGMHDMLREAIRRRRVVERLVPTLHTKHQPVIDTYLLDKELSAQAKAGFPDTSDKARELTEREMYLGSLRSNY